MYILLLNEEDVVMYLIATDVSKNAKRYYVEWKLGRKDNSTTQISSFTKSEREKVEDQNGLLPVFNYPLKTCNSAI